MQLREKASVLFRQYHDGSHCHNPPPEVLDNHGVAIDELSIFGGQARVLISNLRAPLQTPTHEEARMKLTATSGGKNTPSERSPSSGDSDVIPALMKKSVSQHPFDREDIRMQNVHPSLMEYISLLPSTALSSDIAMNPNFTIQPANGVSEPFQFSASEPIPGFYNQHRPADYSMYQAQNQLPVIDFTYDPTVFLEQFYQEVAPSRSALEGFTDSNFGMNDPGASNFDTMDDRWMGLGDWNGEVSDSAFNAA